MVRCPGQDQRYWKPGDIFEVQCSGCGARLEFFKDEPKLKCRNCGQVVANPRIDLGCAEWCRYADQCLGNIPDEMPNADAEKLPHIAETVFKTNAGRRIAAEGR